MARKNNKNNNQHEWSIVNKNKNSNQQLICAAKDKSNNQPVCTVSVIREKQVLIMVPTVAVQQ